MSEESQTEIVLQNIEYKKALTKLLNQRLSEKQQERREFVKKHASAMETSIVEGSLMRGDSKAVVDITKVIQNAIITWQQLDKQLTEIEKGERE